MQAMTEREELIVIEQVVKEAGLTCLGDVLRSGQWYASLYLSTPAQIKDLEKKFLIKHRLRHQELDNVHIRRLSYSSPWLRPI